MAYQAPNRFGYCRPLRNGSHESLFDTLAFLVEFLSLSACWNSGRLRPRFPPVVGA
jgi:hypothetical protein